MSLDKVQFEKSQQERTELLQECQQLLQKIANHRYCLKTLRCARDGLQLIANYKPPRTR